MPGRVLLIFGALVLALGACDAPPPAAEPPPTAAGAVPALTLAERELLPESIAFDPAEGAFYVGSTRFGKIVKVDRDGRSADFVTARQDGLWMVMGMKIDGARRHLWVASSEGDNLLGYEAARGRAAGLFQFDLETGALLAKWVLDAPGETHFFNDLVVTPAGDVFATHMFNLPAVYVLRAAAGTLEIFARPGGFRAPNGIAQSADGRLYVAHREGLSAFDPETAERTALALPSGASFTPIDGLYAHRGALVGVHPAEGVIRRFELDSSGLAVTTIETLVADHEAITGLTTGAISGDTLYFVANSQFARLTNGALPARTDLEDYVVLELALD